MGLEVSYDNFFSLSVGFVIAFAGVRVGRELSNGVSLLRRQWRRRAEWR